MVRGITFILSLLFVAFSYAEEDPLENYIKIGLESNLALKQQQFSLDQSLEALYEARGLFYPRLDINARYTRAGGGRELSIPIGQMINPIYQTLNQLLILEGLPPSFPENIPDQTVPFLREKEHETYIRLVQPIIQPAIWSNYGLKSDLNEIEKLHTDIFKRSLIAEIKSAYYNYLKASRVVDLYGKIEDLQTENLRVSESLFKNGKSTQDVVFRARAELSATEQNKMNVENLQRQARSYFNFILNRSLESDIVYPEQQTIPDASILDYPTARQYAFEKREELRQINKAFSASEKKTSIIKSRYYPGLNGVVDYGFQGEEYSFTDKDDFWRASLVLQWNLFNGLQDKAKLQQARLESKKLSTREEEIKRQIELEVERIYDNLMVARKTIDVSEKRVGSAKSSFKIIRKKFEGGGAAQVEYLDAQTTLTNAAINAILTKYDYLITYARFERIVALYEL